MELDLARQAQGGDESAFAEIVRRYSPRVFSVASRFFRQRSLVEEAAQEVFLKAYTQLGSFEGRGSLEGWLTRIATNTCLNRMRAQRARPEDPDDERLRRIASTADCPGERRTVARDLLARLFRADDPLAASSQTIAVMHLVDGMTLEEVAREAGLSVSGVRKRLRSVRARLTQLDGGQA